MKKKLIYLLFPALCSCSGMGDFVPGSSKEAAEPYTYNWADDGDLEAGLGGFAQEAKVASGYMADGSEVNQDAPALQVTSTDVQKDISQENITRNITPEKIIRTGDISMEVEDYKKTHSDITAMVNKYKGFMGNENEVNDNWRISNNYTIRVPNTHYDALMNECSGLAMRLDHKSSNAQDVSEEYVDIQTRLKTKKEVEKRYVELLAKARSIDEILAIEERIRWIREEIESKEARLHFLDDRVSYSTVTVYVYQNFDQPYTAEASFWGRIGGGFGNGWDGLLLFFVGLANIWPLLLIMLGTFLFIRRLIRRSKKKKALTVSNA